MNPFLPKQYSVMVLITAVEIKPAHSGSPDCVIGKTDGLGYEG